MSDFSRRKFLKTGAAALAGITIAPSSILGMSHGHVSPTDKLNLAAVGIGGMGHANINNVKGTENIVALCDVDWKYAKGVFDEFPNAKKYWDYRKMYDECTRKGGPHPQHIELGSFHRTCQTEPVQQRLSSLELAWMVGLRYRCTG